VFILVTSHAYILYMVATKPYQTPIMNSYILANETFYSALIILIFIFSDATPQINIKVVAAIALMVSIFLLVLANIIYIIYNMVKGKEKLKEAIKEAKKKRIEEEEKEKEEEEERKRKRKEKEEEFSKIPDETNNVSQDVNNTTHNNNTTIAELKGKKGKQAKKKTDIDAV
jgi:predicted membrane protein